MTSHQYDDAGDIETQPFFGSIRAGVRAANRAIRTPIRISTALLDDHDADSRQPSEIPSLSYQDESWSYTRTVNDPDEITVGDTVTFTKTLSETDVGAFAAVTGDTNRLHLEEDFAETTRFGERIVHGTLVAGTISAALARMPGLTIYLSQNLDFLAPVSIDDEVTATVEVVEAIGGGRFRLTTTVETADGEVVIDGEAVVLVESIEE